MRQIVLDSAGEYRRAAVLCDHTPVSFYAAPKDQALYVNDILLVKVASLKPSLDGAFVQLPFGMKGFLPKTEWDPYSIEQPMDKLQEGESLLLQLKREPLGKKHAVLTRNIQIKGHAMIFLPYGNYVAVSQQIKEDDRAQLKENAAAWVAPPEGMILRSSFPSYPDEELRAEWSRMKDMWTQLLYKANKATPPCCLSSRPFLAAELIDSVARHEERQWVTNDSKEAAYLKGLGEAVVYDETKALFQKHQLEKKWLGAVKPTVFLKSGISLIFEETHALTSVDVNTGSFKGAGSKEETAYLGNLEAVDAIARELALRQLGGIILIDLLKMEDPVHREVVLTRFKEALRDDFTTTYVSGYTGLGLLELTRKKSRYSLSRLGSGRNHD